jgi:hypothetical protein
MRRALRVDAVMSPRSLIDKRGAPFWQRPATVEEAVQKVKERPSLFTHGGQRHELSCRKRLLTK